MNKLSVLVVTIFLLLGAAMWYTANISYAPFLQAKISEIGLQSTGYQVSFETLNEQQHSTKLGNLHLHDDQGNALITLENLVITLDPKSFKKAVLNIKQVEINGLNTQPLSSTQKQQIISALTTYINKAEQKKFPPISLTEIKLPSKFSSFTFIPPDNQQGDIVFVSLFKQLLNTQ